MTVYSWKFLTGNLDDIFFENFLSNLYYEDPPLQGLSEARRDGEVVRKLSVTEPPRGRPIGGGGVHHFSGWWRAICSMK